MFILYGEGVKMYFFLYTSQILLIMSYGREALGPFVALKNWILYEKIGLEK